MHGNVNMVTRGHACTGHDYELKVAVMNTGRSHTPPPPKKKKKKKKKRRRKKKKVRKKKNREKEKEKKTNKKTHTTTTNNNKTKCIKCIICSQAMPD